MVLYLVFPLVKSQRNLDNGLVSVQVTHGSCKRGFYCNSQTAFSFNIETKVEVRSRLSNQLKS